MQFLYPKSRQFPFDEVSEQIVRALEARAWKVPGLVVEFYEYGSGAQKLRCVHSIQSDQSAIDLGWHDVKIRFDRPQGRLGRWNDIAAVSAVQLPRRELLVYEDDSGPTYFVYVGDSWERDRTTWWSRPNARLHDQPRRCVKYSGDRPFRGRAATLTWDQDSREHGPEGEEPRMFRTNEVMEEVRAYLCDVVLPAIEAFPVVDGAGGVEPEPEPVPMPMGVGPLFTYGEARDARRIERGKTRLDDLEPADRYGMEGKGWRLAPLSIKSGPDLPEVAFEGFLWCGTTPKVPGEHSRGYYEDQLVRVTPKDARGIYVADHAAYEKRRTQLSLSIKGKRNEFTQEEVDDFVRARACTIVPIVDYKGDYEDPVYLIKRELGLDEVEVVGRRPE